jgi:GMP synthase-like glutamine amidotransferase
LYTLKLSGIHIHYFQHDHFEDLGYIGDWAMSKNFSISVTRFDIKPELPALADFDWLVVMGGKMSVNDTDKLPWLATEINFIKEAIDSGKIVIGVCLGSQLVAKACGATVLKNTEPEMGFWPVEFSPEAVTDTVFRHFSSRLTVLHVHFDTFTLPEGAVNMANSEITKCQAFRFGRNVFALQFHFEVTPANMADFIREITPELIPGQYVQNPSEMLEYTSHCYTNNLVFAKVLDEILLLDS